MKEETGGGGGQGVKILRVGLGGNVEVVTAH